MKKEKLNVAEYIDKSFHSLDNRQEKCVYIMIGMFILELPFLLFFIFMEPSAARGYLGLAIMAFCTINIGMCLYVFRLNIVLNTFHKYATYIWEGEPCSVSFLSKKTGMTEKKIMKDMKKLRKAGLLPKGTHFVQENATFFFENEEPRTVKTPGNIERKKD